MYYKFTARAEKAIECAQELAMELGHDYIGTEHILYGLAQEGTGIASKVMENQGITADSIRNEIEEIVGTSEPIEDPDILTFTPRSKRVIENAFLEARKIGSDLVGTEHILIGIMEEGDSVAARILLELNAEPQKMYNEILKVINEESNTDSSNKNSNGSSYNSTPTLNQYGTDLT